MSFPAFQAQGVHSLGLFADAEDLPPWQQTLRRLTDWIPEEIRDSIRAEFWVLLLLVVLLAVLLILGTWLKRVGQAFVRKRKEHDWDRGFREELDHLPMPVQPPGEPTLAVYHLPVRIRLVVVAPLGKDVQISQAQVPALLDRVFPDLGRLVLREEPAIRTWPGQVSDQGFNAAFHRRTPKQESEGEPSRWILIAGRAMIGKQPLLLGLALYTDQSSSIGRLNLQPLQWLEVLRLRRPGDSSIFP